MASLWNCAF